MMTRICDVQNDVDIEDLNRVMLRCRTGNLIVSLKRFLRANDTDYVPVDIKNECISAGEYIMNIDNRGDKGYVYLDMRLKRKSDMRMITNLFETVKKRGTDNFKKLDANDYALVFDIIAIEKNGTETTTYTLSFMCPVFISYDGESMDSRTFLYRTVFDFDMVRFGIEELDDDEIAYELMSESAEDDFRENENDDDNVDDEAADIISNEDTLKIQ